MDYKADYRIDPSAIPTALLKKRLSDKGKVIVHKPKELAKLKQIRALTKLAELTSRLDELRALKGHDEYREIVEAMHTNIQAALGEKVGLVYMPED